MKTENIEDKIKELNETLENLDLGEQSGDFMICCASISDKSIDIWKIGLELHEDDQTIFSSRSSKFDNQYQILAIIGDNSEEFDDNNNLVLNPANVTRGANHLAEGDTAESLTTRAKIWLSANKWNTIKAAIKQDTAITVDASKEVLQGYHYALHQQSRQLAKERIKIRKRRESASAASKAMHEARNNASHTNSRRHNRHGSRVKNLEHSDRQNLSRNLDSSFLSVDDQGNIMIKTPKATLVVAQTYQYTTQPNPGDPREHTHRVALQGLRLVGNKLTAKEEEAHRKKVRTNQDHCTIAIVLGAEAKNR
jgi:DNA polymerase III gamma/tau subunit